MCKRYVFRYMQTIENSEQGTLVLFIEDGASEGTGYASEDDKRHALKIKCIDSLAGSWEITWAEYGLKSQLIEFHQSANIGDIVTRISGDGAEEYDYMLEEVDEHSGTTLEDLFEVPTTEVVKERAFTYYLTMYLPNGHTHRREEEFNSEFSVLLTKKRNEVVDAIAACYVHNNDPKTNGLWEVTLFIEGVLCSAFDTTWVHNSHDYDEFSADTIEDYDALEAFGDAINADAVAKSLAIQAEREASAKAEAERKAAIARQTAAATAQRQLDEERKLYFKLKEKFESTLGE